MYLKRLKILRINAGLKQTDIADILEYNKLYTLVMSEVFKLYLYIF